MMRIRTFKPEFLIHSGLFELEKETGLPVRLVYLGLWSAADREGRFRWQPRELKLSILPYDDVDFSHVLDALATRDYLVKYLAGGKAYGYIPTFKDHQHINGREQESRLPNPDDCETFQVQTFTCQPRVTDVSTTRDPHGTTGMEREWKGNPPLSPKGKDIEFPVSLNTPEFRSAWQEWKKYRAEKKTKPYVPTGEAKQLGRIALMPDPIAAVYYSMAQGYQGVYEERTNGQHAPVKEDSYERV